GQVARWQRSLPWLREDLQEVERQRRHVMVRHGLTSLSAHLLRGASWATAGTKRGAGSRPFSRYANTVFAYRLALMMGYPPYCDQKLHTRFETRSGRSNPAQKHFDIVINIMIG